VLVGQLLGRHLRGVQEHERGVRRAEVVDAVQLEIRALDPFGVGQLERAELVSFHQDCRLRHVSS
jgi:hypothetical protein